MPGVYVQSVIALLECLKPLALQSHISHSTRDAVSPEIPCLSVQMRREQCR